MNCGVIRTKMSIEKFSQGLAGNFFRHPCHHFEDCLIDLIDTSYCVLCNVVKEFRYGFLNSTRTKSNDFNNRAGDVSGEQSELLSVTDSSCIVTE